jgi:hypothetical protein
MRIGILAAALLILHSGFIYQITSGDETILWSKDYDLVLEDFLGVPDDTLYADFDGATVAGPDIRYHMKGDQYYVDSVRNLFHKKASWIRRGNRDRNELVPEQIQIDDILIHENLHFDISELFVRKLRKRYDSLNRLNVRSKIVYDKIANEVMEARSSFTKEFDLDTQHGKHYLNQLEWEKKISEGLEMYDEYCYPNRN